ncbi:rCG36925 [Rattus norvegicus]|uniref:RCG36925 n=1 Tax=Rattus norvegicus TaxID=10116 RepID=A6HTK1_RAT|nr:rCG36925 [Rattus norvegicus]
MDCCRSQLTGYSNKGNREEGPQFSNYLHQIGLWTCLWGIFLISK